MNDYLLRFARHDLFRRERPVFGRMDAEQSLQYHCTKLRIVMDAPLAPD
jgi:hypothetical protein